MSRLINGLIAAVMVAGIVLAFVGSHTLRWSPPPAPPSWEAPTRSQLAASGLRAHAREQPPRAPQPRRIDGYLPVPMARSVPATIDIPGIKVRAKVISLGLTSTGGPAVPPLTRPFLTSWYDKGPTPGEPGTAVVFGHVDAKAVGPAVFYDLGDLRPGDRIYITLEDRRTALFQVYSAALYLKADFPARAVYGYTSWPSLRLITCGGEFDQATGHYLGNTVVFAQYVGQRADP
jgi:Sortase domain